MALMNEDNGRFKSFTRRALLLGAGQGLMLTALAGRMYYLQVVESDRYAMLAEDNRINLRLLPPPRGRIVDRYGLPVALNQRNYRVVLVRELMPDVETTLNVLGAIIRVDEGDRKRVLRETQRKRAFVPVTVRENLSWDEVSRIEVNTPNLPGISIEVGETRRYPFGEAMAHVIGYVAAVSERELTGDPLLELPGFRIGKNGIERFYDLELRGSAGTSHFEVNALGRVIRELSREEGRPGREAVLSIDAGLQNYVHQRLLGELSAAAVVLDIETGDLLALASVPGYDPNAFSIGLSGRQWNALITDPLSPLSNKTIAGTFAPGSTFKPVVALAALEAGISPSHRNFCPGFMRLGNIKFHCWKKYGHGSVDMHNAIKQSCNVYFYDLARRLGIDRIEAMARRLGLGRQVGVDLPGELPAVIPSRDWKQATLGEVWHGGETLNAAIGQGFVLTTPLQLAVMTARLASGREVVPRLLRGFGGLEEPVAADTTAAEGSDGAQAATGFAALGIPEAHLKVVRDAMDAVVNDTRGTAYRRRIEQEGWEMAGKTGTSQVRRLSAAERAAGITKNEDLPWRRRDHGVFIGYAPVHKPRYACAVIVEHGGGGSKAAAPLARDILAETQRRDPAGTPALPLYAGIKTGEG